MYLKMRIWDKTAQYTQHMFYSDTEKGELLEDG